MKIIKTRKRTEIEITPGELKEMIYREFKKYENREAEMGIRSKSYAEIAADVLSKNPLRISIFKSDDDIREEEREKIFNSTLGDICYIDKGNGKKERWVKTFNGRATLLDNKMMESLKKNIRQEEREKVIEKVLEIMKESGNVYHNSYRDIRELKN